MARLKKYMYQIDKTTIGLSWWWVLYQRMRYYLLKSKNIAGFVARLFKHRHKWQVRGRSPYQNPTYRVCLKCRQAQEWEGGLDGKFVKCEPIPELDAQFDENDNYIFNP